MTIQRPLALHHKAQRPECVRAKDSQPDRGILINGKRRLEETMQKDLTEGSITGTMLRFALPMILGNLLQQCYNVADTLIVGRFLGADALVSRRLGYTL